ncbi:MAG: hypothetical protein QE278_07945 [Limnobacter sp.]|nr:hypothetical protein [Limnobacter sp.]
MTRRWYVLQGLMWASLLFILLMQMNTATATAAKTAKLDLTGYMDESGAISVLYEGDSADPYFAMQALLLARDNGFNIEAEAERFINWLLPLQKPDGTFDRFCRSDGAPWVACKTADADDSLLAMWMMLLDTLPQRLQSDLNWSKSYARSKVSLEHLYQPSRGIYVVSPVYLHGLFMDNLEVWAHKKQLTTPEGKRQADRLQKAIKNTFWDPVNKRFLVSTQLEQRSEKPAFYPDHLAQIFPLLVNFPVSPPTAKNHYRAWMKAHRDQWLEQSQTDYPWGLLAVLAVRQGDRDSARCWIRESEHLRHTHRWAVTDEVSYQIVLAARLKPATKDFSCYVR